MTTPETSARACLERTRSAVLNVLIGVGTAIALSGVLLRWRDGAAAWRAPENVRRAMLAALAILAILSYALRRSASFSASLLTPAEREERFYLAHLRAAVVGALAVPLGLAYGWTIRPRLDAVSPFWVAALALGFLALPRAGELESLPPLEPDPSEPKP